MNKVYIINTLCDYLFLIDKVNIRQFIYGGLLVYTFDSNDEQLDIGDYCSIQENVRFVLGGMQNINISI